MKQFITCLLLFVFSSCSFALEGKVISIADGDTLTILTAEKQQIKIRLSGIDTPESNQAFGTKAKQALSAKVFGKVIEVKDNGQDRYKRTLGDVYYQGRWINLEMIQEGWAWHYKQYSNDQKLAQAEQEARRAQKGLWADSNPIPPWDFRRGARESDSSSNSKSSDNAIAAGYWLNASSGVRHNSSCRYYKNTKRGKPCGKDEGKACGICGG